MLLQVLLQLYRLLIAEQWLRQIMLKILKVVVVGVLELIAELLLELSLLLGLLGLELILGVRVIRIGELLGYLFLLLLE